MKEESKVDPFQVGLQKLVQFQEEVAAFHPAFKRSYPIALALIDDQQLLIYDRAPGALGYALVKTAPSPIPLPEGVMAAFPLEVCGGQTVAVVTPAVFEAPDGLVMLLHEFVHCYQDETCMQELRDQLKIAQEEEKRGHVTWEIDQPFPYEDEVFVKAYTDFLRALEQGESAQVARSRQILREHLAYRDYEYMVWEEWVEGFARWNENRLRHHVNLPRLDIGAVPPYNRISFYVGGAAYIDLLVQHHPEMAEDLTALFGAMFAGDV